MNNSSRWHTPPWLVSFAVMGEILRVVACASSLPLHHHKLSDTCHVKMPPVCGESMPQSRHWFCTAVRNFYGERKRGLTNQHPYFGGWRDLRFSCSPPYASTESPPGTDLLKGRWERGALLSLCSPSSPSLCPCLGTGSG